MPDKDERWLYERINRAKMAPQGICVLDAGGHVLAWVQMFDDDKSVLDFLEYGLKRFQDWRGRQPPVTDRFLKYPSAPVATFQDRAEIPPIAEAHPAGKRCPAQAGKDEGPAGSLRARLVGRRLDEHGRPLADVVRQEHYVEDQFSIAPGVQQRLARALKGAGDRRVRLPDDFGRLCAAHAFLGHIDVQPCMCMIPGQAENKGRWKRCEFWARPCSAGKGAVLWRLDGRSEVLSAVAINGEGVHNVKLTWDGYIELRGEHLVRLVLSARGTEKLQFAKENHPLVKLKKDEVAFLPAGRPIDQEGGVRYGIIGERAEAREDDGSSQGRYDR